MARTIHETRKDLAAASDEQALGRTRAQLNKKRRIKKQVQSERSLPTVAAFSSAAIPIHISDQSRYVHYPASPDDIRSVIGRLPVGVLDGLDIIQLCLARAFRPITPAVRHSRLEPDPYTGRLSYENMPGVYTGRVLGTYWPARQRMRVYAYVYDAVAMTDRPMWELYLRLKMLSTFVHEAAHHFDNAQRVARGRWLMHGKTKVERYAEEFQHRWVHEYVVPYLLEAYPQECAALNAWVAHYGGVSVPLSFWAGEPRTTEKRGGVSRQGGVFSCEGALEALKRYVDADRPLIDSRLRFARELHWAGYSPEALAILERVSRDAPGDTRAPILRADILVHLRDHAAASEVLKPVLKADKNNVDALFVLADVHEARQEWLGLARVTTHLLDRLNVSTYTRETELLLQRATACVRLGDYAGAREDLYWLRGVEREWMQMKVAKLKQEIARAKTSGDGGRPEVSPY